MRLTGSFVLPKDTQLQPALELSEELRRSSGAEDGDFALSRRNSRTYSKIVDAAAAELIRQFESPSTIAVAVARFSRSRNSDSAPTPPEQILEDALPLLRSLIGEGLLVEAASIQALPTTESLASGVNIDGWLVARCVQSLEDTELYLVHGLHGQWGALKIGRPGDVGARLALAREAELLGTVVANSLPRLLATSIWRDRPYLVTEWISGVDAQAAAAEIRSKSSPESRREFIALGAAILEAYTELHELGLLHGDIHPRNLLVDRSGLVKVLDFGLAARVGESGEIRRAGVSFFFEPEFARAALEDLSAPAASLAGEQYALASLLYLLLSGSHTQDFALERREMLAQIATGAMIPLARRGIESWPHAEQVLTRALSKDPGDRYPSTRAFSQAWHMIETPNAPETSPGSQPKHDSRLRELRSEVLRKAAIGGEWMREGFKTSPTVPINNGCAGLAFALHRIACATADGELHAAADAWSTRSLRAIESQAAFESENPDPQALKIGPTSLHHHRPGVYAAETLIASARGDIARQSYAADQFVAWGSEASKNLQPKPEPIIDLTIGLSGSLLGAALLLDSFADPGLPQYAMESQARLLAFGRDLYAQLWNILDGYARIGESPSLADTGMAHGWAGILYASLCWHSASACPLSSSVHDRMDQFAVLAEPFGRGLQWPWGARVLVPGWCNGTAGQVFLWTQANEATGDHRYLVPAEGAAWNNWETPSRFHTLCCGLAGQAYALLNFHRHSGDAVWLRRAKQMAVWAAEAASSAGTQTGDSPPETRPGSLYNGIAGIAVLDADLESPLDARMPFFERD